MKNVTVETNPAVKALGKLLIGMGLVGVVLWLSPMTLTDLLSWAMPLLTILALLAGFGFIGSGVVEMLNTKTLGERVQTYVRQYAEQAELQ